MAKSVLVILLGVLARNVPQTPAQVSGQNIVININSLPNAQVFNTLSEDTLLFQWKNIQILEVSGLSVMGNWPYSIVGKTSNSALKPEDLAGRSELAIPLATFEIVPTIPAATESDAFHPFPSTASAVNKIRIKFRDEKARIFTKEIEICHNMGYKCVAK